MSNIRVRNLSKSFKKGKKALDDISIDFHAGEMVALIGASGSGKSTLIRHIAGLTTADRDSGGVVEVRDTNIQKGGKLDRKARHTRTHIGVIFQQFNLVNRMSVLGNVLVGRLGKINPLRGSVGIFTDEEKRQAMIALDRVGMAEYARQRASTLSGGQQQRVAIARTLMQQSEVILADEPIASLDPESSRKVMDSLAAINKEDGKTVIVSLHQVDYALKYCKRTVALKDGKVHYDGPSTALSLDFLRDLYGSDSLEMNIPDTVDYDDGDGVNAPIPQTPHMPPANTGAAALEPAFGNA